MCNRRGIRGLSYATRIHLTEKGFARPAIVQAVTCEGRLAVTDSGKLRTVTLNIIDPSKAC